MNVYLDAVQARVDAALYVAGFDARAGAPVGAALRDVSADISAMVAVLRQIERICDNDDGYDAVWTVEQIREALSSLTSDGPTS